MIGMDLLQGDCLELMKDIPDGSVDAVVTDPPYLYLKHKLDRPFDEDAVFEEWFRVLKKDGLVVVFGRGESFYRWNTKLIGIGFEFKEEIIWDKINASSPFSNIGRTHETISILSKGNAKIKKVRIPYLEKKNLDVEGIHHDIKRVNSSLNNPKSLKSIETYLQSGELTYNPTKNKHGISGKNKTSVERGTATVKAMQEGLREVTVMQVLREHYKFKHPTQKPVRLMERLINLVSESGDTILDPFAGSGSTGIACKNLNRSFIGMELDENYFSIAKERIENHKKEVVE